MYFFFKCGPLFFRLVSGKSCYDQNDVLVTFDDSDDGQKSQENKNNDPVSNKFIRCFHQFVSLNISTIFSEFEFVLNICKFGIGDWGNYLMNLL